MKVFNKVVISILITLCLLAVAILVGPIDIFSHGYYSDELSYEIIKDDILENFKLTPGNTYEMSFSPQKNHFVGFELYLVNQPEDNEGELNLEIIDDRGDILDTIIVKLDSVSEATWYKTNTSAKLEKNKIYKLRILAKECKYTPELLVVDPDYLTENVEGNLFIRYAYAKSTFTFQNKVIFGMFMLSLWLFFITLIIPDKKNKVVGRYIVAFILMTAVLTWNYMYNSMDNQNTSFDWFENSSESYVKFIINSDKNGGRYIIEDDGSLRVDKAEEYGLGTYWSFVNKLTNDDWVEGYSKNVPAIVISSSDYTRAYAVEGNYIKFENGDCFKINEVINNRGVTGLEIYLDADRILNPYKYGDLLNAYFCDENMQEISSVNSGWGENYISQYGLQGKIFRFLAIKMNLEDVYPNLYLICCLLMGMVISSIIILLYKKYNVLFASTFFVVFWLSPWVVNFARNLYWVEFTWFVPMAVGLFCSWKVDKISCRLMAYILAFVSVTVKCLCGYEYISTVMMGLIEFLLVDFVMALMQKEGKKAVTVFKAIFIIGIMALAGFVTALCIHGNLRGNGDIIAGIKDIIEKDVLRRTHGVDLNVFSSEEYIVSSNASIWETVSKYFHFNTSVITGVTGNLFPLLCIVPLLIFAYDIRNKKLKFEQLVMYCVFFFTTISWLGMAKAHSFVHTHMNYVLWYFGFVQLCFYTVADKIASVIKNIQSDKIQYVFINDDDNELRESNRQKTELLHQMIMNNQNKKESNE